MLIFLLLHSTIYYNSVFVDKNLIQLSELLTILTILVDSWDNQRSIMCVCMFVCIYIPCVLLDVFYSYDEV
jgi:uncharacterized membrane protein